jgi:hypothetical protein
MPKRDPGFSRELGGRESATCSRGLGHILAQRSRTTVVQLRLEKQKILAQFAIAREFHSLM